MPQRGGKRPGAGRPRGSSKRVTAEQYAELSALARQYAKSAILALVKVATKGESEAARVSAATAILDRGYGKPAQSLEHSGPGGGPIEYRDLSDDEIAARIAAHEAARDKSPTAH